MQVRIEPAHINDAPQIAGLLTQLGYPATAQQALDKILEHTKSGYHLLVAREGSYAVGFVSILIYTAMHQPKPIGRITAFCIEETLRNSGIGSQLLQAAESYIQSKNCFKVELTSNLKRLASHRFYLNRGYLETNKHFIKVFPQVD